MRILIASIIALGCCTLLGRNLLQLDDQSADRTSGLQVIATTGQINSALQHITAGTDVNVTLFCGPGVDPHSFGASTNHVAQMMGADLIIYNGFHLEAKLADHLHGSFKDKSWAMGSAFPARYRLDWVEDGKIDPDAPFDPHIWNHLPGWAECVSAMAEKLAEVDPNNADTFRKNAAQYVAEITQTHHWAAQTLSAIPRKHRYIVSAHDAFHYFAKNYDMQTMAVLGIGNDAEADIRTMREVASTICEKKIPAIFLESITNPKVTEALSEACRARGWDVKIVSQALYSDDLGEEPPVDTFLGAFKANVELMVQWLK
jgi:manganese/zinc/iron transport system substrate-binding protein